MTERIPHDAMAYELTRMISAKAKWLADFSSGPRKRPSHEVAGRENELRVLEQARNDYRRAAERSSGTAATVNGLGNQAVAADQNRRFSERQNRHSG